MTGTRPTLPTMLLVGKGYFIDLEARLFRETMDPGRYVDFDSVKGKWSCQQAGVVTCLSCGASVIVSGFHGQDPTTRPCDASRTSGFGINLAQLSRSQPRIAFSGRVRRSNRQRIVDGSSIR